MNPLLERRASMIYETIRVTETEYSKQQIFNIRLGKEWSLPLTQNETIDYLNNHGYRLVAINPSNELFFTKQYD